MTSPSRRRCLAMLLAGAAGAALPASAVAASEWRVLVFLSDLSERTQLIAKSFKSGLSSATALTYDLSQEVDTGAFIADRVRGQAVDLVMAIGDRAALAATREFVTTPVVVAEITDRAAILQREFVLEVSDLVDPKLTLDRVAAAIPSARRVGVLRSPHVAHYVDHILKVASPVEIVVQTAHSAADLGNAFKTLLQGSDLVWILPDPLVWSPSALAHSLRLAASAKRPVLSFSRTHLDAPDPPALIVHSPPSGVGDLAADLANRVLGGENAPGLRFAPPVLIGHFAALRAAELPVGRNTIAALDELVR